MIELKSIGKSNNYITAYAVEIGDKSISTIKKAAISADLRKISQHNKKPNPS